MGLAISSVWLAQLVALIGCAEADAASEAATSVART